MKRFEVENVFKRIPIALIFIAFFYSASSFTANSENIYSRSLVLNSNPPVRFTNWIRLELEILARICGLASTAEVKKLSARQEDPSRSEKTPILRFEMQVQTPDPTDLKTQLVHAVKARFFLSELQAQSANSDFDPDKVGGAEFRKFPFNIKSDRVDKAIFHLRFLEEYFDATFYSKIDSVRLIHLPLEMSRLEGLEQKFLSQLILFEIKSSCCSNIAKKINFLDGQFTPEEKARYSKGLRRSLEIVHMQGKLT